MPEYIWNRDKDGTIHIKDDVLLAYIRGQVSSEIVLTVQQHCAKCTRCEQKCTEYTQIGTTLQQNLTYAMPVYPSIVDMLGTALDSPEAASAALYQRQENRKRVRKEGVRTSRSRTGYRMPGVGVLPLTVSVSLVILATLLVYMFTTHVSILAFIPQIDKKPATPPVVSTLPFQQGVTQTSAPKKNASATVSGITPGITEKAVPTLTPSPTVSAAKPTIWLCSSQLDLSQSRLRICGTDFKAGDRVFVLEVLPGINHKVVLLVTADTRGSISGAWTIQNCRNVPYAIFAFDVTRVWSTPSVPVNISIGGCRFPGVKPSSYR